MLKMVVSPEEQMIKEQAIAVISSDLTSDSLTEETNCTEINSASITAYFQDKFPSRIAIKNKKQLALLISDLKYAGVRNCSALDELVNDSLEWFNSFENAHPASDSINHSYSSDGVIRLILSEKLFAVASEK
jgi:hypothetical protein